MQISVGVDFDEAEEVNLLRSNTGNRYELYMVEDGSELTINYSSLEEVRNFACSLLIKAAELEVQEEHRQRELAELYPAAAVYGI